MSWNWMSGRQRDDYLFSDGDLGDSLRQHVENAVRSVDQIPEQQFKGSTDDEHAQAILIEYQMAPIVLRDEHTTFSRSETKMEVNDYGRRIHVNGIRVVFSTPFEGDANLWKLKPNRWQSVFPRGEIRAQRGVRGGFLDIVVERPADEDAQTIQAHREEQLRSIRFYLESQREQIAADLAQLPARLSAAIGQRRARLGKHNDLANVFGIPERQNSPVPALDASTPAPGRERAGQTARKGANTSGKWDVFVSHASEDKQDFARPLADALRARGLNVWFDEFALTVGDSLRRSIDRGLANSRFGVVVISPHFLEKEWPQKELDGLTAREVDGRKVILPVWHNVDKGIVTGYSPLLADRLASNSAKGLQVVVDELMKAIGPPH